MRIDNNCHNISIKDIKNDKSIRYEYEDSNSNCSFAGNFFKQEPTFMDNFDTYFPTGFDLTQHHVGVTADAITADADDWEPAGSLEHMITDFSPADLNLELLTDSLLLEAEENRQQLRHELQPGDGRTFALSTSATQTEDGSFRRPLGPSNACNQKRLQDLNEDDRLHEFDCQPSTSGTTAQNTEYSGEPMKNEALSQSYYNESKFLFEDVSFSCDDSEAAKSGRNDFGDDFEENLDEDLDDDDADDEEDEAAATALTASENLPPGETSQQRRKLSQSKSIGSQRRMSRDDAQTTRKDYAKRIEEPQMAGGFVKPSYSYSCLITLALKNSGNGELTVSEIYAFLCEHFPYFRAAPSGWKNSVRHNLSLNKSFQKIEVETPGCHGRKSCLWRLNPNKAMKMEQELRKWRDRSESLILSAMRSASAADLDAIQSGRMGMPASVRRRATVLAAAAAVANANANHLNSSSSGYSTSTVGSPYIGLPKSSGSHFSSGAQSTSSTTIPHSVHQPKVIRRVLAASSGAADFDEFDAATSPTTSSSSSSCSPSTRMRLRGAGADESTGGTGDTPPGGTGGGKLLHRQAARKLDYLLQQKSATIFNPSKELFAAPNAAAIASTSPGKRMALNSVTPSRSPLSTLSQSDLKSRRREALLVSGSPTQSTQSPTVTASVKRLSSSGYSILINRQTSSTSTETVDKTNVSSPKRFRPTTTTVGGYNSVIKTEPDELQRQNRLIKQQQQQLSSPYCNVHNDENLPPLQQHAQHQKMSLQHQQPKQQLSYDISVRSPFRRRQNHLLGNITNYADGNNGSKNVNIGSAPFQISSGSFRLSETSNLSPSRRALIKERQQHFAAQASVKHQTAGGAFATAIDAISNNSLL